MKNMFRIAAVVLCLYAVSLFPAKCFAGPAYSEPQEVVQPNGTVITVQKYGDEFFNWTAVGEYVVMMDETGVWRYVTTSGISKNSLLPDYGGLSVKASGVAAENNPPANALTVRGLLETHDTSAVAPSAGFELPQFATVTYPSEPYRASEKLLVLLVEFTNIKLNNTLPYWQNMFFGETNSVNSYYRENSNGKFKFDPALGSAQASVIKVSLPMAHPNTGSVTSSKNQDLVTQALKAVDSSINFNAFDKNGDGYVSPEELHICFIVAGYEASYSSASPSVWAHRWGVVNIFDGVGIVYYTQAGEMLDRSSSLQIGTICHELGHDLGAPDLYNTDVSTDLNTPRFLSVMDLGSWGSAAGQMPGSSPVHFDPWCKTLLNFYKPTTVSSTDLDLVLTAPSDYTGYGIVKIPIAGAEEQYYLVEYRTQTGYDKGLYIYYGNHGNGVVLWLIDEGVISFRNVRTVNNLARKGVMWLDAGSGDPFIKPGAAMPAAKNTYYGNPTNYTDAAKISSNMVLWADSDTPGRVQTGIKKAGVLDYPADGQTFEESLTISGWYLYSEDAVTDGITSVEVYVGDRFAGYAERYERADVRQAIKGYPDYSGCGFMLNLNTPDYPNGDHAVRVRVMSGSNAVAEYVRTVRFETDYTVRKVGYLDNPADLEEVSGSINVSGWYLYEVGTQADSIAGIEVFIDGEYYGNADRFERSDVKAVIAGFKDYGNCGFSFSTATDSFADGSHIVSVRIKGKDGGIADEFSREFSVKKQIASPFLAILDTPVPGATASVSVDVTGWALYSADGIHDSIARVDVLLDGEATSGVTERFYRPDVEAAVSGYTDYSNCGYSKTVSLDGVSQGEHRISVMFYDSNGNLIGAVFDRIIEISTNASPFLMFLDNPINGQAVTGTLEINGWTLYSPDGSRDGITGVQAYINGQTYQMTRYRRDDVADAVTGYGDYSNCAFQTVIDISDYSNGDYVLIVTATGEDGASIACGVIVTVGR